MNRFSYISSNEDDTISFGKKLLPYLSPGTKLTLKGDLGSGKTTLVKGIYQALNNKEPTVVNSPTFTYLNIYEDSIYHFDLYRLNSKEQFISMGFDEYLEDNAICIIEWPDIISSILPNNTIDIFIGYLDKDKRKIEVQ